MKSAIKREQSQTRLNSVEREQIRLKVKPETKAESAMKWFKEKELCCKCCGQLPPLAKENIEALVENVLDPLRERYGKPIVVNSGYRCPKHNAEVGGAPGSQHMRGEACDIRPVEGSGMRVEGNLAKLRQIILANDKYDQLIIYPTFLHVSWKRVGQNRRMVLEKTAKGYRRIAA